MSNQDPEWYNEQKAHNASTQLSAARITTPLIVMLLTYGILHFFEVSESAYVLGFLAFFGGSRCLWRFAYDVEGHFSLQIER
jgi:hypothetical protein